MDSTQEFFVTRMKQKLQVIDETVSLLAALIDISSPEKPVHLVDWSDRKLTEMINIIESEMKKSQDLTISGEMQHNLQYQLNLMVKSRIILNSIHADKQDTSWEEHNAQAPAGAVIHLLSNEGIFSGKSLRKLIKQELKLLHKDDKARSAH